MSVRLASEGIIGPRGSYAVADTDIDTIHAEHAMTSGSTSPPKFHRVSRAGIRRAHARHPYAHHIRTLPAALESLAPRLQLRPGDRILDYGCADQPYRRFFAEGVAYVGADLDGNPDADVVLRPDGTIPVPEASFDAVMSTQVLEHVTDPGAYLSECFRVLRPGGRMLLSTHGVFAYHPDPVDLWRWTCAGLRLAVEQTGFRIVEFEGVIGLASTGLQLFQDAISYRLRPRWVPWLALVMQPIVTWVDRFESDASLSNNAQVFALIAERPA
jgi:SAM-dependent methyltransferase